MQLQTNIKHLYIKTTSSCTIATFLPIYYKMTDFRQMADIYTIIYCLHNYYLAADIENSYYK